MGAGVSTAAKAVKSAGEKASSLVDKVKARTQKTSKKKAISNESPSILRVHVLEGRNLPAKDDNGLSDPYITLQYGTLPQVKTDIRFMSVTPQWSQTFDFPIWNTDPKTFKGIAEFVLQCKCWDYNDDAPHAFMGGVELEVGHLQLDGEADTQWHVLTDPSDTSAEGEVHISLQWATRTDEKPDAILSVNIIAGRDIPAVDSNGFSDPYAVVRYKDASQRTRHIIRSLDPDWMEIFEFGVRSSEVGAEKLELEVWDKGMLTDKIIGVAYIDITDLQFGTAWEEWFPLEEFKKDRDKHAEVKKKKRRDDEEGDEDLGRVHLEIKLKKMRANDTPDLILRVSVLEAKRLPTKDRSETGDPYFAVEFERSVKKTQVRFKQTLMDRPTWSETFTFGAFSDRLDSILMIKAMDHNEWFKDTEMGSTPINLLDLSIGDLNESWYSLTDTAHPDSQAEVKLQIMLRQKPAEKDQDASLKVRVVEAKDLPALDYGGTSDPYVNVTFEGKTKKSSTIFKTLQPKWNETLEFPTCAAEMDNRLVIEVLDHDFAGSDDSCGWAEVDMTGLQVNQSYEVWLPLRDMAHPEWKGEILIEYLLLAASEKVDPDSSLTVRVIEARGLLAADAGGTSDPYVKIDFNDETRKTGTRFKTLDPVWNEVFEFVTHSRDVHLKLRLEAFDYDLVGRDDALGHAFFKIKDLTFNKSTNTWLPLRLREGEMPIGEVHVDLLIKKLPEFFIQTKPRSKSIDLHTPYTDIMSGMVRSDPVYSLERKFSLASSGLQLDCESTQPLIEKEEDEDEDELQQAWNEEQKRRKQFDAQRASELRAETVDSNLRKGRNRAGRCAWCGESFSILRKAVQDPVDNLWYHIFTTRTVKGAVKTCYVQHKPHLKQQLRQKQMRENEHEEEMLRRANFDREWEAEKSLRNNRQKLKKAFMTDSVGKLAKRTGVGKGRREIKPPFAVHVFFPPDAYGRLTSDSRTKRAFGAQLRQDVAELMRITQRRVTIAAFISEACAVEVHLHQDPDGKDLWFPEALANKFAALVNTRREALYPLDALVQSTHAEVKGPVISLVATALLDANDMEISEMAMPSQIPKPDQAGRIPVHVYFCADFDDLRPEREFLFSQVFPVLDTWLSNFRIQFVPADLRFGVSRTECFHRDVIRVHMDEIDHCFPFFVVLLGEAYGWQPDRYFRDGGQLGHPRFDWIQELPLGMSLTHLEIIKGYFQRKLDGGDEVGGGRDDDYCVFYLRSPKWLKEPAFLTDVQLEAARIAAEKKALEARKLEELKAARKLDELSAAFEDDPDDETDFIDIHIMEGLDLAFNLEGGKRRIDDKMENKMKKSKKSKKQRRGSLMDGVEGLDAEGFKKAAMFGGKMIGGVLMYGGFMLLDGVVKVAKTGTSHVKEGDRHTTASRGSSRPGTGKGKKGKKKKDKGTHGIKKGTTIDWSKSRRGGRAGEALDDENAMEGYDHSDEGRGETSGGEYEEDGGGGSEEEGGGGSRRGLSGGGGSGDGGGGVGSAKQSSAAEESESEDEEEEEDEDEDSDYDEQDARVAILGGDGNQGRRIRMVQISEDQHQQLIKDLKALAQNTHANESMKLTALMGYYRGKWWTCDRMRQYMQLVKDPHTREQFLDGPTHMFKRCVDAASGGLNEIVDMVKDEKLRVALRQRIEVWENESTARGAVKGAVDHEEMGESSSDHEAASQGAGGGGEGGGGGGEGGDGDGSQPGATGSGGVGDAGEGGQEAMPGTPPPPRKDGRIVVKTNKFGGYKWVLQDAWVVGGEEPYIAVKSRKGQLKLNGFDVSATDWFEGSFERHGFKLTWNGTGTQPPILQHEFRCKSKEERDEWVSFVQDVTGKVVEQEVRVREDGSEKAYMDGKLQVSIGGGMFAKWAMQDMHLFCMSVREVCNADGRFSQDKLLPKSFATLQLFPPDSHDATLEMHEQIMEKASAQEQTIRDRPIKYMRLDKRPLVLVADQFGFSKSIRDYITHEELWNVEQQESDKGYNYIMKHDELQVVTEEDLKGPDYNNEVLTEEEYAKHKKEEADRFQSEKEEKERSEEEKRRQRAADELNIAAEGAVGGEGVEGTDVQGEGREGEGEAGREGGEGISVEVVGVEGGDGGEGGGGGDGGGTGEEVVVERVEEDVGGEAAAEGQADEGVAEGEKKKKKKKDKGGGEKKNKKDKQEGGGGGVVVSGGDFGNSGKDDDESDNDAGGGRGRGDTQDSTVSGGREGSFRSGGGGDADSDGGGDKPSQSQGGGQFASLVQMEGNCASVDVGGFAALHEDGEDGERGGGSDRGSLLGDGEGGGGGGGGDPDGGDSPVRAEGEEGGGEGEGGDGGVPKGELEGQAGEEGGEQLPVVLAHDVRGGGEEWDKGGEFYIKEGAIWELTKDDKGEPLTLINREDEGVLWEDQTGKSAALTEMMAGALLLEKELYWRKNMRRQVVKSGKLTVEVVGTVRDYENPNSNPIELLDATTKQSLWKRDEDDAEGKYDKMMKYCAVVGYNNYKLRSMWELDGRVRELDCDDEGQPRALVDCETRAVFWERDMEGAEEFLVEFMLDAGKVGNVILLEYEPLPPEPRPEHTSLDLYDWEALPKGKDLIVLTWRHGDEEAGLFGTHLGGILGKEQLPKALVLKAQHEVERDDWFRQIRAGCAWARVQEDEKGRWEQQAAEYDAMVQSGLEKAVRRPGVTIEKTEDQLDAYRAWVYILVGTDFRTIGRSSKSGKAAMAQFRQDLVGDIAGALELKPVRVKIISVQDARSKDTWKGMEKDAKHYLQIVKKTLKNRGTMATICIDPDVPYVELLSRDPEAAAEMAKGDPSCLRSAKALAMELSNLEKNKESALYKGSITHGLALVELRSAAQLAQELAEELDGFPVWLELEMGGGAGGRTVLKTKTVGTKNAAFDEVLRLYVIKGIGGGAGPDHVKIRAYTTKMFGKRLLGTCEMPLVGLTPNVTAPMTLRLDENPHGVIALQAKYKVKKMLMPLDEERRLRALPDPLLKAIEFKSLRQRHTTEEPELTRRMHELKEVLRVEANVFNDYPAYYDGIDALGRARLSGLEVLGDRIADDVFALIKQRGVLARGLARPHALLDVELAQQQAWAATEGALCVGRYDVLKAIQEYILEPPPRSKAAGAPPPGSTLLALSGPPGSGKSNVLAFITRMFTDNLRVAPNPHTRLLQIVPDDAPPPPEKGGGGGRRGGSWARPHIVSAFVGASKSCKSTRFVLLYVMAALADILDGCECPQDVSGHKHIVPPNDPARLRPIPSEYNSLKLLFQTLCNNIDTFEPQNKILIILDQVHDIKRLRFDWLPVRLPHSIRVIVSHTSLPPPPPPPITQTSDVLARLTPLTNTRHLPLRTIELPPLPTLARKEMLRHAVIIARTRELTMRQSDVAVLRVDAQFFHYMKVLTVCLGGLVHSRRHVSAVIHSLPGTVGELTGFVMDKIEAFCGEELTRFACSLLCVCFDGLAETELLVLLADVGRNDQRQDRLSEEGEVRYLQNPGTPYQDLVDRLKRPRATLPFGLWAPLNAMLKPYCRHTSDVAAELMSFEVRPFEEALVQRYRLDHPRTPQGRGHLHMHLAAYFRARADPELQFTWRSLDYRASRCLLFHLMGAKDWGRAAVIMRDLGYLELCVNVGHIQGLLDDFIEALHGGASVDGMEVEERFNEEEELALMQVYRFLSSNSRLLLRHPALLMQLMANEPKSTEVARMAAQRIGMGWEGKNWFRWMNKPTEDSLNTRVMRGHKGWVRALATTADGKYIVSGADDRSARFWAADTGQQIHELLGHREAISCVAVSNNGQLMITGSMDATVKVWEISSGIELASLYVGSATTCCSFDHTGEIVIAGAQAATLHVFSTVSFEELYVLHGHTLGMRAVIFSADSQWLLSSGNDRSVCLWGVGEIPRHQKKVTKPNIVMLGHTQGVRALSWHPRNRERAASCSDDGRIIVWDLRHGRYIQVLKGNNGAVLALAYTPSGSYIASSCHDGTVCVWDPELNDCLLRFWGHAGPVYAVVVTLDEYTVMSAGADSTIRAWDIKGLLRDDPALPHVARPQLMARLLGDDLAEPPPPRSGAPSSAMPSQASFTGSRPPTREPRLTTAKSVRFKGGGGEGAAGASMPGSRRSSFRGSEDGGDGGGGGGGWGESAQVERMGTPTNAQGKMSLLGGSTKSVIGGSKMSLLGGGSKTAVGGGVSKMSLVGGSKTPPTPPTSLEEDGAGGRGGGSAGSVGSAGLGGVVPEVEDEFGGGGGGGIIEEEEEEEEEVVSVSGSSQGAPDLPEAFTELGQRIPKKGPDQRATSMQGGKKGFMQYGDVFACCFDPSGETVLSTSQDTSYAYRSAETGEFLGEPVRGHAAPVYCAAFHPEGRLMVTGSGDKLLKLWLVQSNAMQLRLQGHAGSVLGVGFMPAGGQMVSVSTDHSVRAWDVEAGKELFTLPAQHGHMLPVRCVSVSPEDNVLATGGDDAFVRVWDLRSKHLVRKLISHTGRVTSVAFSPDGSGIISGAEDGSARLWDLNGALVNAFEGSTAGVQSVCYSPSGRHLVVGSADRHVTVYNSTSLGEVGRWVCQSACQSVAASTAFGGVIATGDSSGTTYVLRTVLAPCGQWRYF